MIGKLYSGSWGGAIFPPDEEIAITSGTAKLNDGARKIKPSKNRNRGGLIFRFLIRSTSLVVRGLLTTIFNKL